MVAVGASICRCLIADRGVHRFGLVHTLTAAGIPVHERTQPQNDLRALGLMDMDVLLEVDGSLGSFGELMPRALRLQNWIGFLCLADEALQPMLVVMRKNAHEVAGATAADHELVTLLAPPRPPVTTRETASVHDTLADTVAPLATAEARLADLAGEVAHDLNNLLSIIRGHCQFLGRPGVSADMAGKLAKEIDQVGAQAALLTGHLVAAARSEALPAEARDVHEVVTDCAGLLQSLLGQGIELILRLDPHPCRLLLMPGQLERVLVNLAANARDAMPHGGTLTITTAVLDFDPPLPLARASIAGPHVLLTISDTGHGFNRVARTRLAQPRPVARPRAKGLGLGIVTQIVAQHGGHLELSSPSTPGASWQIFLPLAGVAPAPAAAKAHTAETILLVEDEAMVRSIFRRILLDQGYFVLEATTGFEALVLAEQFSCPIHLLITDVSMPHMNGMELANRLASLHAETGVLYLSGYSEGLVAGAQAAKNGRAFLQKPFQSGTLVQKVRELLARP